MEPRHPRATCRLEHGLGAHHVGGEEPSGVEHGERVVRLRCEVNDGVDLVGLDRQDGRIKIADVSLDEGDLVKDSLKTPHRGGIGHDVVDDHRV